ncbi:hypothetical protein B566_EDAN000771 [Ephemera danica]|nr:hypothetical protein B566_EDAN000771 [Ephemera danica]
MVEQSGFIMFDDILWAHARYSSFTACNRDIDVVFTRHASLVFLLPSRAVHASPRLWLMHSHHATATTSPTPIYKIADELRCEFSTIQSGEHERCHQDSGFDRRNYGAEQHGAD